jgi:outer membrane receptor protein involved in Fe transport
MIYFTWSEGYRPGGVNRDPGLLITAGTISWIPDILTNYEFGWKTTLADGRVRFNGAVYFMDWDDIQYTVYNGSLSICCGSTYNLETAEISGVEADLTFLATDALMLRASFAYNDAETTATFVLPSGDLAVPKGTALPNVPELKANLSARYEFEIGGSGAYAQLTYSYTGSSRSEITSNSFEQDAYSFVNVRAGLDQGGWGIDVYVNNATNEVAEYYVQPRPYAPSTLTNRPRSIGAGFWMRF